eukprot:Amastigsp_a2744_6.p5 type:complete len:151 gc:universal Amastigsp_a2744_6:1833-1381(-)
MDSPALKAALERGRQRAPAQAPKVRDPHRVHHLCSDLWRRGARLSLQARRARAFLVGDVDRGRAVLRAHHFQRGDLRHLARVLRRRAALCDPHGARLHPDVPHRLHGPCRRSHLDRKGKVPRSRRRRAVHLARARAHLWRLIHVRLRVPR